MVTRRLARGAIACVLSLGACSPGSEPPKEVQLEERADGLQAGCSGGAAIEIDGQRRLALVVGVGQYKADKVPDLAGPPNDARRIYDLLTSSSGFGFPRENVCLLLDEQATTANFKKFFDEALVGRARSQDVAVLFYAGHGSQTKDLSGDEPDQWDETLMLQDARSEGQRDLVDDELYTMLVRLHAKTRNVVMILDSCNSGTAMRSDGAQVARFFEPDPQGETTTSATESGDGDATWGGEDLGGLISFTAASDGTPALEQDGKGIFTDALIRVLSAGSAKPLTYAGIARQVPPLMAADSYQIPYFQGDLQRPVFESRGARRALGWDVVDAGSPVKLAGAPLPGSGVGAELRVYPDSSDAASVRDPRAAKATLVVTQLSGVNAEAKVKSKRAGAPAIAPGDLAVLVRPADVFLKLRVALRAPQKAGGIPAARAAALRSAIQADDDAKLLVEVVAERAEFELSTTEQGLVLRGPENRIRNSIAKDADVPRVLWQHARQRALLQLHAEGGSDFVDNETLQVRLIPTASQPACAKGKWVQGQANLEQVIPLCHQWNVEVALAQSAPMPLRIGALLLSSDGSSIGLPRDGRTVLLKPGEKTVFNAAGERFRGTPPLDTRDEILVFGTQERNPVDWGVLTQSLTNRTRGIGAGALAQALDQYLRPGRRGVGEVEEVSDETTWTMSALSARVEANSRFLDADASSVAAASKLSDREYTIKQFDVRPYLPDDRQSALYKVLQKADWLARVSAQDGFGYKQHDWSQGSDEANLRKGIDCSRAIWFAFTRNGLPYNRGDRYLTTSEMVSTSSPMSQEFDPCPANGDFELGDVLVYRSTARGDGHVVMVIDPAKRISWGSHGWDGAAKDANYAIEADTGVEYQRIKYKPDWKRWDRGDMEFKRCWRYRRFTSEAADGSGKPGVAALSSACDENSCRR